LEALEEIQITKPRTTNSHEPNQGPTTQDNDMWVYFRKKKTQKEVGSNTTPKPNHEINLLQETRFT